MQSRRHGTASTPISAYGYCPTPATERRNLAQRIREAVQAWSEVPWDELGRDAEEDPRQLFGPAESSFGTRNGLWPIASTWLYPLPERRSPSLGTARTGGM
ncbi:hypothetical protein [Streptomyces pseudovenezuelae]|uniref:Uncharacterized protein n=1 Tax=Streptomyces pseudovenezuelae TaxID=67350 RepID=A0A101N232_9ACTN|nr:hypothetical protein AQI94_24890 [Streptomyces pseudovenezuelae]